jgi:hypothetical protein
MKEHHNLYSSPGIRDKIKEDDMCRTGSMQWGGEQVYIPF